MAVRLTPKAQADLEEIWDYTRDRWGAAQAERYVRLNGDIATQTAEEPQRGRPCDDIRPGYFRIAAGSHVLFYKLSGANIDVIRILHGRMDFQRHL